MGKTRVEPRGKSGSSFSFRFFFDKLTRALAAVRVHGRMGMVARYD